MKSTLLTISLGLCLFLCLVGFSVSSYAEVKKQNVFLLNNSKELIIQIEDMNEKNVAQIRNDLEATGGLVFNGYCRKLNVLMYSVDTDIHPDYNFLNPVFMNLSMGYLLKNGATIRQVQIECEMDFQATPTNPQE